LLSDDHQRTIEACLSAVAERQFVIAFQQAGAELPSLRSINKYCARHANTLFVAWQLCPDLEVLCMSLNAALQEEQPTAQSQVVSALKASALKREYAAPEYMHLLRSCVELFGAHVRPQSADPSGGATSALRNLQEDRRHDLALLTSRLPQLRSCIEDIDKCYGEGTTAYSSECLQLLSQLLSLFDVAVTEGAPDAIQGALKEEAAAWAELQQCRVAVDSGFTAEQLQEGLSSLLNELDIPMSLHNDCEAAFQSLSAADTGRAAAELRRLSEQLRCAFKSSLRISDPSFDIDQFKSMKEALAGCLQTHARYATLVAELIYGHFDGGKKSGYSGKYSAYTAGENIVEGPPPSCPALYEPPAGWQERDCACRLELFLLHLRAVEAVLAVDGGLAESFAAAYGGGADVPFQELREYFARRLLLLFHIQERGQVDVGDVFISEVDEKCPGIYCAFDPEFFWFKVPFEDIASGKHKHAGFAPPSAVLALLRDLSSAAEDWDPRYRQLTALMDRLATWERDHPLPAHTSEQHYEMFDAFLKDPVLTMIGLKLAFLHRDTASALVKALDTLMESRYPLSINEALRALLYLKEGRDHAALKGILEGRLADIHEYVELEKQCRCSDEAVEAMRAAFERYNNLMRSRETVKTAIFQAADSPELWLSFEKWQECRADQIVAEYTSVVTNELRRWDSVLAVHAHKCNAVDALGSQTSPIIEQTSQRARLWRCSHEEKVHSLSQTTLPSELTALVSASKKGIATYRALERPVDEVCTARIADLTATTTARAAAYRRLVCLRNKYGPPWYFGGGERRAVKHIRPGNTLTADQLLTEKWRDDLPDFTDSAQLQEIDRHCPAEAAEALSNSDTVVGQPKEYHPVVILHTSACKHLATTLETVLEAADLRSTRLVDPDDTSGTNWFGYQDIVSELPQEAKVLICLIDQRMGAEEFYQTKLAEAEARGLGIAPVVLQGFQIDNYQQWWPATLPMLARHSLFIDARTVSVADPNRGDVEAICSNYLIQTIKVLLSEHQGLPQPASASQSSNLAATSSGVQRAEAPHSGPQYLTCEMCAGEGTEGTADAASSCSIGRFDRWHCQQLVGLWTADELRRREESPDSPAVVSCPATVCCSGRGAHVQLVRDVLAVKEKKTSYPCPSCVSKGVLPPYCFDREVCLAELEYSKGGSILCKRCHGSTALHTLLVCEVFLSYCWGAPVCPDCSASGGIWRTPRLAKGKCTTCSKACAGDACLYDTQRLITLLKQAVEPEAGVMCWQDIDRLVGGKDLEREMEVGVKQADVVVIFLDDGYVNSFNCRREYLHCTKHGKYVIPVLLRGYTMPASDRWWPESMSSLAQFEPVKLREAGHWEQALFEICERIQSRFHRAQRFPTADDAIAYLRDYSSWGVARKAFLGESLSLQRRDEVDAHLRDTFARIDTDGNCMIDEAELAAFLDENKLCLSSEQISTLMMEADVDLNGQLSLEELKLAIYAMLEDREKAAAAGDD
jgi:hypothetical protein